MIAEKMKPLVANNSAVREMFEEGARLKGIYGDENVYDFSLGNPNVAPPQAIMNAIIDILNEEPANRVHGYMSNAGFETTRYAVAESLNRRFGTSYTEHNIIMSVGAGSALNVILKTILNPGEEVITFAPYFLEYGGYVRNYDGELVVVPADTETFQPNLDAFEELLSEKTRAVIINTPHNPTGVIYSDETLKRLTRILLKQEAENGSPIFLISDEPYRELAYDGAVVPWVPDYYKDTIVGYSFSKSLSLPGERIGYIVIPNQVEDHENVITAATIATRVMGMVNAPSLMQLVIERCIDEKCDIAFYENNRNQLYNGLTGFGFECVKPEGAFYLWMKSPVPDEKEFVEAAKEFNILMVPGSSFACPGYVRLAYCVSFETIMGSMEGFGKLAEKYGL